MQDSPKSSTQRLHAARQRQQGNVPNRAVLPAVPKPTGRRRRKNRPSPFGFVAAVLVLVLAAAGIYGGIRLSKAGQEKAGMTHVEPTPAGTPAAEAPVPVVSPDSVDPVALAPAASTDPEDGNAPGTAEASPTPEDVLPQAPNYSMVGDWLSEEDAETYAEVICLEDNGACSMISTRVESEDLTGWRDGRWYTAPIGDGTYTIDGNTLTFTLSTQDGIESYRYELTWLSQERFIATIYIGNTTPHNLLFTRVG